MCKRNSPDKNKACTGCVRESVEITKETSNGCVTETPHLKMKPNGMFKRKSPDKNEASTGCVRETRQIKMKPAWDV